LPNFESGPDCIPVGVEVAKFEYGNIPLLLPFSEQENVFYIINT
jgi:hypothetical protein